MSMIHVVSCFIIIPKTRDSFIFTAECTQSDPLHTVVIFFHIAQGYHTPSQGRQHNYDNNHGYAWTRGI